MGENFVKHLISCQDVLTKAAMQTFELALLPQENYTPLALTWLAVVYTKNCCLSSLVISFHTRCNINGNRKIVLGDRSRDFVPADNESQPRESLVEIFSQHYRRYYIHDAKLNSTCLKLITIINKVCIIHNYNSSTSPLFHSGFFPRCFLTFLYRRLI